MSRALPYRCLSIAKDLLHASKCVVREIYYTTATRTKMRSATVHGRYLRSHILRGRAGGGVWTNYVMVCKYARKYTTCSAGPQKLRSLLDGRDQKVRRSSSERLTPKRSKKGPVGLNERYFSIKFHGYDVKRTSAYTKCLLPRL